MTLNLNHNKCIAIQNNNTPICKSCIEYQMLEWVKLRNPGIIPGLKNRFSYFFQKYDFSTKIECSICHRNSNTCDFCLRQHVKNWIKERYPRHIEEFNLFFDFR